MNLGPPTDDSAKEELAAAIHRIVGATKRPAGAWLRLFARTLADPVGTLAEWDQASQTEHSTLSKNPERTSAEIVRDLYRYQVELLKQLKRDDEAIAVIRRTFTLLDGTPDQVLEIVDWLIENQAWPVVVEVAARFNATFQEHPQLLYCLAETHDRLGQADEAEKVAQKALAIRPESADTHLRTGAWLEHQRGRVRWAEGEYRQVVKTATAGAVQDFVARFALSELLHDQFQELAAAEALAPLCELMKKDEAAKETCERANRRPPEVVARMNYFYSCHYRELGDRAKERQHLETAVEAEETDADVLIAMFRLGGVDESWKAKVKERIDKTAARFLAEVEEERRAVEMAGVEQNNPSFTYELARLCNQYAWLVGNTIGDYDQAVKLSHKSLELRPNYAGFLDTLGRCYYGKGDFASAVKYQSQAVKLNSSSGQIRKQLEFFIAEAKKHGVALPADTEPPAAKAPYVPQSSPEIPRPTPPAKAPPRPAPPGKSPSGSPGRSPLP
jgi:tetratricopeptide (TPR) repeat protein